jgi:hypothetical protein
MTIKASSLAAPGHRHPSGCIFHDLPNCGKSLSYHARVDRVLSHARGATKCGQSPIGKDASFYATMHLLKPTLATAAILASGAAATNFTGDVLNGVRVINELNLADVPAQSISRYYLRVGELNGGHPVHIPIMVARGTPESLKTGKKLSLSAAIHGDELNPVRVVQRIFAQLEGQVSTLNGTGMTIHAAI